MTAIMCKCLMFQINLRNSSKSVLLPNQSNEAQEKHTQVLLEATCSM